MLCGCCSFTIVEDDESPIEGSGTRLTLHLKDDSEEYLDDYKVKELCQKYSEFVSFPIQVSFGLSVHISLSVLQDISTDVLERTVKTK